MNTRIQVITKGSSKKTLASVCPWVMDVPPETPRQS